MTTPASYDEICFAKQTEWYHLPGWHSGFALAAELQASTQRDTDSGSEYSLFLKRSHDKARSNIEERPIGYFNVM